MKPKRLLSALLVFAMVLSMCPVMVFATSEPTVEWEHAWHDEAAGIRKLVGYVNSGNGVKTIMTALNFDNKVIQPVDYMSPYNDIDLMAEETPGVPYCINEKVFFMDGRTSYKYVCTSRTNGNRTSIELTQTSETATTQTNSGKMVYMEFYFKVKDGQSMDANTFKFASLATVDPIAIKVQDGGGNSWGHYEDWNQATGDSKNMPKLTTHTLTYPGSDVGSGGGSETGGINVNGASKLYYWKWINTEAIGEDIKSGQYDLPMNWNSTPKKGDHTQMLIPSGYSDEGKRLFSAQAGNYITQIQFVLTGHYHDYTANQYDGTGTGYQNMLNLAATMKKSINLGEISLKLGTTDLKSTYSSNKDYVTGLTEVKLKDVYITPYDNVNDHYDCATKNAGGDNDWVDLLVIELEEPFPYDGKNIVIDIELGDGWDTSNYASSKKSGDLGFYWRKLSNSKKSYYQSLDRDGDRLAGLPRFKIKFSEGVENVTVTPKANEILTADGSEKTPEITVTDNISNKSLDSTYYTATYALKGTDNYGPNAPTAAGDYTMLLTFKNGYSGTKSVDFTVQEGFSAKIEIYNDNQYYTGEKITPDFKVYNKLGSAEMDTSKYSVEYVGDFTSAGTHSIVVKDVNSNAQTSAEFTILKASNTLNAALKETNWTYGGLTYKPSCSDITFGADTVQITYYDASGNSLGSNAPTDAGSYTVEVKVPGTSNYTEVKQTISFTIAKQNVTGIPQFEISNSQTLYQSTNATGDVPLKFNKADNHTQTIIPADQLTGLAGKDLTSLTYYYNNRYDDSINLPTMTVRLKEVTADEFVGDNGYFYFESMNGVDPVFSGKVEKGSGNTLVLNFGKAYRYDGGNLLIEVITEGSATSSSGFIFSGVAVDSNNYRNPSPSLEENNGIRQAWFSPKMTFGYKGMAGSVVNVELNTDTFTYNKSAQAPTVTVKDGENTVSASNYTVTYTGTTFGNASYNSSNKPTDAGNYKVVVIFDGNYTGTIEKSFTIQKAEPTVSVTIQGWAACDEEGKQPQINTTSDGKVTYEYAEQGVLNYSTNPPKTAGNYIVKANVAESPNYQAGSADFTFTVSDHIWQDMKGQAADCEQEGYVAHKKCTVCDKTDIDPQTTPALGHSKKTMPKKEATCDEDGYEAYQYCDRCQKPLEEITVIPKHEAVDKEAPYFVCDLCNKTLAKIDSKTHKEWKYEENKACVFTGKVDYDAHEDIRLTLKDGESKEVQIFHIADGKLYLCGNQVSGEYPIGTYELKVTVNPGQKMGIVEVKLPNDGLILRRGSAEMAEFEEFAIVSYAYHEDDVTDITVTSEGITSNYYSIKDSATGLGDSLISNLVTSFSDARTTRNFAWTASAYTEMTLQYKAKDAKEWASETVTGSSGHFKADITGLNPGTTYQYKVVSGSSESKTYTFTTAAADTRGDFSFIALGDTQNINWKHAAYAEAAYAEALENDPDAQFILHTGDVVNRGDKTEQWNQFFQALGKTGASVPHFAAIGNHDYLYDANGSNFNQYFNHPTGESNDETSYSFDYGDAHFIVLNSGKYEDENGQSTATLDAQILADQKAWLEADLAANSHAKWTIVMMHQTNYHRWDSGSDRNTLASVFESNGVDLVIQGHSHLVTRTYPMNNGQPVKTANPDTIQRNSGTVYVTVGATTSFSRDDMHDPNRNNIMTIITPYTDETTNGTGGNAQATYSSVEVTDGALTMTIRQLDGLVLDQFTISGNYTGTTHSAIDDEEVPATCTEPGKTAGSHCSCGDVLIAQTQTPALNHNWGETVYNFAEDGKTCTATRTCANDGTHKETATATITSVENTPATCVAKGWTTYTATFGEEYAEWATTQTQDVEDIPAKNHKYATAEVTFSEDGTTYTVAVTCSACDENVEGHTKTSEDMNSTETGSTAGDCQTPSTKTYEAKGDFEGVTYEGTKTVGGANGDHNWNEATCAAPKTCSICGATEGAKLAHTYGAPVFAWDAKVEGATCKATFTCTACAEGVDGHEVTVDCSNVTENRTPATCGGSGSVTYTAAVTFNGQEYTSTSDPVTIDPTGDHTYSETLKDADGHWTKCSCGATTEKKPHADETDKDHKCDTCDYGMGTCGDSNDADHKCDHCGADNITEHTYSTPTWAWTGDETNGYTAATATFQCDCGDERTETDSELDTVTTEPTTTADGKTVYTAKVIFGNQEYSAEETVKIPMVEAPAGVTVSGVVKAYNGNNDPVVKLYIDGVEKYAAEIGEPEKSGSQWTWMFTFDAVAPGTYDLVVSKDGHLDYTVTGVVVDSDAVDLKNHTNAAISTISMLCGDIDGDNVINSADINVIYESGNYRKNIKDATAPTADLDGDSVINSADINIIYQPEHYRKDADNCTFAYK